MEGMRYRLRTLLILLAILPPMIWGGYWAWSEYTEHIERRREDVHVPLPVEMIEIDDESAPAPTHRP
jgi:hypothetical protein